MTYAFKSDGTSKYAKTPTKKSSSKTAVTSPGVYTQSPTSTNIPKTAITNPSYYNPIGNVPSGTVAAGYTTGSNNPNPQSQYSTSYQPYGGGASQYAGIGGTNTSSNPINPTGGAGLDESLTGWVEGIKPTAMPELFNNPEALLRQFMFRQGLDPDRAIGAMMQALPFAQDMNQLAFLMLGGNPDFETGEFDPVANWMGNAMSNLMTPGGRTIDFGQGMSALTGTAASGDSLSPLGGYLGFGTPSEQVAALRSLAVPLANSSLHPLWARSFSDELSRQGAAYVSKNAMADSMDPFNMWLANRMGM